MSKAKFEAAREFIREGNYAQARLLLESIDHPQAKVWLDKLQALEMNTAQVSVNPPTQTKKKQRRSIYLGSAFVALCVVIVCAYVVLGNKSLDQGNAPVLVETLVRQQFQETEQARTLEAAFEQAQQATAAIVVATRQAEVLAGTPVTTNADWTPIVQEVGGVPMVQVPAGCFMMGSTEEEIAGLVEQYSQYPASYFSAQGPQHEQCFEEAFWIGQTEVTNAQYAAFIDAGGYTNAAYWTDVGWSWRQIENRTQPDCWTDSAFNQPDQPVVCVSWYEAVAYSAWLSATSGEAFRLPTEAEWEYAARGPDGLEYPWGNEWNADNAVTDETSGGQSAAVGSRPAGTSWVGALDMSGNVWEWLSSQYQPYPYSAADGREDMQADARRVGRGGSWGLDRDDARGSRRSSGDPFNRGYDDIGFRVLRPLQNL
jgi:formylglycine-generating enzyme required for sulfatase activity